MSLTVDASFGSRKTEVLEYLRSRSSEHQAELVRQFGVKQIKKRASGINKYLATDRASLLSMIRQSSKRESWNNNDILESVLLLMHCSNVVMLESRNEIWPYEYMAFSRRIGELWEPFVTTCFDYPVREDVTLFSPPLFRDVKERLNNEVRQFGTTHTSLSLNVECNGYRCQTTESSQASLSHSD